VPTITALISKHRSLVLQTLRAGQGRILSSTGEVSFLRVYLYFPLSAKRTRVPVLLYNILLYKELPKRRTAAKLAGSGVDCLLSPGGCSPGRALKITHRLYILWWLFPRTSSEDHTSPVHPMVDKLIMGMLGRDYGGITITAGPIRSRNHTPTKHLGSSLLDHIISRHMRRERIRPSTPPAHTLTTLRRREWASKYHGYPASETLPKRGTPP